MSEAEKIAAGLTKGQTECIRAARHLPPELYGREGWELTGRSANSLSLKRLAEGREIRSFTGRSRRGIALTPLGLEVRTILQRFPATESRGT